MTVKVSTATGSFHVKSTRIYEVLHPTISEFSTKITTRSGMCHLHTCKTLRQWSIQQT